MILNNSFSRDTHDEREERLYLIQTNFSTYSATLVGLPAEIATWTATCRNVFRDLRTNAGVDANEAQGATIDADQKIAFMEDEYQVVKGIAEVQFGIQSLRFKNYGFDKRFPDSKPAKLAHVSELLVKHARLVADAETDILPAFLITRLQTAYTAAATAFDAQQFENIDSESVFNTLQQRKADDTTRLQILYKWVVAYFGDDGSELPFLGFRRKSDMGQPGGGQPPAKPEPEYDENTEMLSITETGSLTSANARTSANGGTTWTNVAIPANTFSVMIARGPVELIAQMRVWNSHGVSPWSDSITIPIIAAAPPSGITYILPENGNSGITTCVVPAGATAIEFWYQADGYPASQVGFLTDGQYIWTLWQTPGTIMLRAHYPGGVISAFATLHVN